MEDIFKDKILRKILDIRSEEDIQYMAPLSGGFSGALLYKFIAHNKAYVMKRSKRRFGNVGLEEEFNLCKIAADLGIAPKVYYTNVEKDIIVTEFIHHQLPSNHEPRPLRENKKWLEDIIKLIKKVQNMPVGKFNLKTTRIHEDFHGVYKNAAKSLQYHLKKKEKQLLERIVKTPRLEGKIVFSHGDFNVANLLYNNERFYLIDWDWEYAKFNHYLLDVAHFSNFLCMTKSEGLDLLTMYLEHEPTEHEIQQFNHLRRYQFGFRAVADFFTVLKSNGGLPTPPDKFTHMTLEEIHIAFSNGNMRHSNAQDACLLALKLLEESGKF